MWSYHGILAGGRHAAVSRQGFPLWNSLSNGIEFGLFQPQVTMNSTEAAAPKVCLLTSSFLLIVALLFAALSWNSGAQTSAAQLKQAFANPPDNAKPMVRWWWFGIAVDKPEILRELQQMKADGIGGVEMAFEYPQVVDDPAKGLVNQPFLSQAMLDNVTYAQAEARKLGLRVDVTLGSGWPYGGPATPLAEAAGRLRIVELAIPPGTTTLPAFQLGEDETTLSISLVNGEPKHWDAATAQSLPFNQSGNIPPSANPRTALVFIASHTRQTV